MIRLWPWQHRAFARHCTRYALLMGGLQGVVLLSWILLRREPWAPVPVVVVLNRPFTVWDLWLIQLTVGIGAGLLFFWLGVRVVCPKCLARVRHNRRRQLYYCGKCDEYLDDGTMERLAQVPPPPIRSLSE
jgi:hypothetical protein